MAHEEQREWEPLAVATLLRTTAQELEQAQGLERNGLFLELHRLQDTIFRTALLAHPTAPPALAAQAFSLADPLPAPQVVRELNQLESELITAEIQRLYQHMNAARNNLAHQAVLDRVIVSNANVKRMVRLANLVADRLDPHGRAVPAPISDNYEEQTGRITPAVFLYLLIGLAAGLFLGWLLF